MGGRDLADAMAHDGGGLDPEVLEHSREGHLQQEVRRLCDPRLVHARCRLVGRHLGEDRPTRHLGEGPVTGFGAGPEHGISLEQRLAHAPPLRPHAREHEDGTRRPGGTDPASGDALGTVVCQKGAQLRRDLLARGTLDGEAVIEMRPMRRRRRRQRPAGLAIHARQSLLPGACHQAQRALGACRDRQQARCLLDRGLRAGPGRIGRAQDRVGVGAAIAEGVDADIERLGAVRPQRPRRERQGQPERGERNGRVGLVEMDLRRHLAMAQAEAGFDQARHPGGGFEMADIGLDRADDERLVGAATRAHGPPQRLGLERVADGRAGAVGLDVPDRLERDTGAAVDLADQALLRLGAGDRDAVRPSVLVDPGAADHRMDAVAVPHRILEPLQEDDAAALATRIAVGLGVEALAVAVAGQEMALAHDDGIFGREHHVDAARHGEIALALEQALAGVVQRHERGRTGGVHGDAGTAEVEDVGQARRQHGHRGRGRGVVRVEQLAPVGAHQDGHGVEREAAHVDAGPAAREFGRDQPRVLHGLPTDFEQQALLRIHVLRLARRDAEEQRIEAIDRIGQKTSPFDVGFSWYGLVLAKEPVRVPSVLGDVDYGVFALRYKGPQVLWTVNMAWETAAHSDDGDGPLMDWKHASGPMLTATNSRSLCHRVLGRCLLRPTSIHDSTIARRT